MKQPHILCDNGDLAKKAIVVGDPARVERIAMSHLVNPQKVAKNREFTSYKGLYKGEEIAIVSTGIGGPSSAIAVEEMANIGVKTIIRVGSCGSISPNIKIGDVVIPDKIIRGDGIPTEYISSKAPAVVDPEVFANLKLSAEESKSNFHTGTTVSVDWLYNPNLGNLKAKFGKMNAIAQEMEGSTIVLVSQLRNIKAGCIFLVVNNSGEKNVQEGILKYTNQATAKKGELVSKESEAAIIALESLIK